MIFTPPQSCGERRNGRPTENNWKLVLQNISSMGVTVYSIVRAVIEIGNLRIWTEMDISLNGEFGLGLECGNTPVTLNVCTQKHN